MDDLAAHTKRLLQFSSFFIAACLFAWAILPSYRSTILGIILGFSVSVVNSLYLAMKVKRYTEAALSGEGKRVGLGFATRAALSVLAVLIAYKFEPIDVYSTVASLFFAQFVIFGVGIVLASKNKK